MRTLENVPPGAILSKEFLIPLKLTPSDLAQIVGMDQSHIEQIIAATRSITPDTAIRLGRSLNVTPQFWLNLQTMHDLEEEARA